MAKARDDKPDKKETVEKQISLNVLPQDPESRDIYVEVTRGLSGKKRRSQRRLAVFLFAVMILNMYPMVRNIFAYHKMKQDYQELQQYHEELLSVQRGLEEERESLFTPDMIERLAREELDMVLPGESKVYQAIPSPDIPRR